MELFETFLSEDLNNYRTTEIINIDSCLKKETEISIIEYSTFMHENIFLILIMDIIIFLYC